MKIRNIEILEKDPNKKGDLFGRLMSDFFHTLGYDEPRLNIHKSGREIDITSHHRTEHKIAIAECKAHKETIGGAEVNKFVGVLDAERKKLKRERGQNKISVIGYFISLSGFKETAIEQEKELENGRVILIEPEKVIKELINGKVLVSIEKAISSIPSVGSNLTLIEYVDLLAYNKGWVWILYYSNNNGQSATHFALVHAEGKPLISELANEIIAIDNDSEKLFEGLTLIIKKERAEFIKSNIDDTKSSYFKYLENELGDIQFEGLPTDKEAGSVKVRLESIFVPLNFIKIEENKIKNDSKTDDNERESIGSILTQHSRVAILAKPGGGKSTLIKRIAIAYAFPERRILIDDMLPDKKWFPIFIRCRELGEKVTLSITEIINNIPTRAEITKCTNHFQIIVSDALQNGNALLLIDGLDEIAEDKNRIAFVNQLRTFVATYPTINIIVTSREAGFRVVADFLATYCEKYSVSNLRDDEIKELSLKWHRAIIDDSANTASEANRLAEMILKDSRIKVLAENPLLLTTLLFVKRWAGYLPTKRTVLYQEMIKLLLVTWNVEGHEILDIEEVEPQLAFVAFWMTTKGQQTITYDDLISCLISARKQMPEILGYTKVSPSEFISRVELRSSLLILSGHKKQSSGHLTAVYEFLHLSFQEYLTAKAIVKNYTPQSESSKKAVEIIMPNVENEIWKEVIPLTAVLLERDSKELIEYLVIESKRIAIQRKNERILEDSPITTILGNCLANEIQISPTILEEAIEWFAKNLSHEGYKNVEIILTNKFNTVFRKKVNDLFLEEYEDKHTVTLGSLLATIFQIDTNNKDEEYILNEILRLLKNNTKQDNCTAILGMMEFSFLGRFKTLKEEKLTNILDTIFDYILNLFKMNDKHYNFTISWCIVWSLESKILPSKYNAQYLDLLLKLWIQSEDFNIHRMSSWALKNILTPDTYVRDIISHYPKISATVNKNLNNPLCENDEVVSVFIGALLNEKIDIEKIKQIFLKETKHYDIFKIDLLKSNIYQFAELLKIDNWLKSEMNKNNQLK